MHWSDFVFFSFGMLRKPSVALMKQKEGDTGHRQLGFLSEVGLSLPGERGGDPIPFLEEEMEVDVPALGEGCRERVAAGG